MRTPTLNDDQLLDALAGVFRIHGYEGASLSRISEATGLQRASLYHRFPGGKEQIAQAVLDRIDERFSSQILAPLTESGDPHARVRRVAERIGTFYGNGDLPCMLDTLALGVSGTPIRKHIEQSFTAWLDAFTAIAREVGHTPAIARRRAEEALMLIQGSLVLSRATGDHKPMKRTLRRLPEILLEFSD